MSDVGTNPTCPSPATTHVQQASPENMHKWGLLTVGSGPRLPAQTPCFLLHPKGEDSEIILSPIQEA